MRRRPRCHSAPLAPHQTATAAPVSARRPTINDDRRVFAALRYNGPVSDASLPFFSRFLLSFACWFRVVFDGVFAAQVRNLAAGDALATAGPPAPALVPASPPSSAPSAPSVPEGPGPNEGALSLLALLQREGRLVDFIRQDVAGFSDADVGAAARVVHEGCRRALDAHFRIETVRAEEESTRVTVEPGFDPDAIKLTGNVRGDAPFSGTLRHRGWRAAEVTLPELVGKHDRRVLAPAEVEL